MARKSDEDEFNRLVDAKDATPSVSKAKTPVLTIRQQSAEEKELDRTTDILNKLQDVHKRMEELNDKADLDFTNLDNKLRIIMDTYDEYMYKTSKLQEVIDNSTFRFEPTEETFKVLRNDLAGTLNNVMNSFRISVRQDMAIQKEEYRKTLNNASIGFTEYIKKTVEQYNKECSCIDLRIKKLEEKEKALHEKRDWVNFFIHILPTRLFLPIFGIWGFTNYLHYAHQQFMSWVFIVSLSIGFFWDTYKWANKKFGKDSR